MYLSKIEIIGFKSFAQRIDVNFDAGVTSIVGPNGCGKTNIVDAIRWALGEQRYSTLRSDKMEDVIFNGTKNRKPLGLAEVSLTIENTKGILPTEYSEVTITRRVFRSGESEYLLNKVPCRLKDILDLFMDTGMGSDAYSVIELKMVETILSDKTDERRKLFEEAAGVTKYKFRRKAAMRKLESVQQDLTRVNDIVKEVQKTVNSLERQAKRAEQYNDVSGRLKALEIDLIEREYSHLDSKLRPLEEQFARARTDRTKIDEILRREDERVEQLRSGLNSIEEELREKQRSVSAQFEAIHRIEEKILINNERLNSLTLNVQRCEREKTDLQVQDQSLAQEFISLQARSAELQQELDSSESLFSQSKNEQQALGERLDAKKIEAQSFKDTILGLAHTIVEKRGEQERVKARIDNLKGRVDRSLEDNTLYQSDIERNQEQVAQLTSQDRELRRLFVEAEMRLYEKDNAKEQLKAEIELLEKQAFELHNEIERKVSKIDFLRRMIESNEGYSEGMRYLLARTEWQKKDLTTVADLVQVPDKYRVAIEAALADAAQMLVVGGVEEGRAAVEELKRNDKGKATFICLDWVPKMKRRTKARADHRFVRAADVVQCEERYRPLLRFLLDDAVIVETSDAAPGVLSAMMSVRCISLDGQVTTSVGVLRGGGRRLDEGGLIGKKSQITELEIGVRNIEQSLAELRGTIAQKQTSYETFDLKSSSDTVKSLEKEMTAIEMRIAQLEFEKKRANDGVERNRTEIESVEREVRELLQVHAQATEEVSQQEQRKGKLENLANTSIRELETLEERWNEKSKTVSELEIKTVTLQGDVRNIGRDIERTLARREDIRLTFVRRDEEIERAREEIARLTLDIESLESELGTLRADYDL